jgi:hypothetical protein
MYVSHFYDYKNRIFENNLIIPKQYSIFADTDLFSTWVTHWSIFKLSIIEHK